MMNLIHTILFSTALSLVSLSPSFSMDEENRAPQKKTLSLVKNTFNVDGKDITVQLAYKYSKVNPDTTRFFFEGEIILIDPETSPFETYVTGPLLPCFLGRIYDPMSGKSLVFHKDSHYGMLSLQPFYEKLEVTNPEKLEVCLYGCAMSEEKYKIHKQWSQGRTQSQEMIWIRNYLTKDFKIPKVNIELRFFRNFLTLPELGEYQQSPTTGGVTKTGELFHTSLVAEDVFGLENVELPPELKNHKVFSKLPGHIKSNLLNAMFSGILSPTVRNHFSGAPEIALNCQYGELKFFSSEELNVPATSLPRMFNLKFGDKGLVEGNNPFVK